MYILPVRLKRSPVIHSTLSEMDYSVGTQVVVQGRRGPEVATVRGSAESPDPRYRYNRILRQASKADIDTWLKLQSKGEDIKWLLRAKAKKYSIKVKVVSVDFTLDESLVTISYSADERVELGNLINDLRSHTRAKVSFSAISPREQAQILGALGACGRENCSSTHLQDFAPVSIRMARDQQLPLNPDKLSGPCGRLLCCLQFEHTQYLDLLRELPRKNAKVCHDSSGSCGKVTKLHPLAGTVDIQTDQGMLFNIPAKELSSLSRPGQPDEPHEEDDHELDDIGLH